jgi:hypothetical protein
VSFSNAQAIIWQTKFIINSINNKKALTSATIELANVRLQNQIDP